MNIRFFTLHYNEETGNFEDGELQELLAQNEILSISEQFFVYRNLPKWGIVVKYTPLRTIEQKPLLKQEQKLPQKEEPYMKVLEQKDWPLFEKLREWRKEEADKIKKPLYIILDNMKLAQIAHSLPKTLQDLENLKIGQSKVEKYGKDILQLIEQFLLLPKQESACANSTVVTQTTQDVPCVTDTNGADTTPKKEE